MTEDEARAWVTRADVPRETVERLERLASVLMREVSRQNLVARSTLDHLWSRHFVDSLQLLAFALADPWLDIGSGAGFPGLVLGLAGRRVTLVEPRPLRAAFLRSAAEELALSTVTVVQDRIERASLPPHAVITARAVASLTKVLGLSWAVAAPGAVWVLPKGRSAAEELDQARDQWHGRFELMPSITDPHAAIVVATDVRPRKRR